MSSLINKLVRPNVRKLAGYVSARHLAQNTEQRIQDTAREKIYLDANENSFGSVLGKVQNIDPSRYPDPFADSLRGKLAKYAGAKSQQILIGNGSDEIIWLLLLAFVGSKDAVIVTPPTFSMYQIFTEVIGARVQQVALEENYSLDPVKLLKKVSARTKIIFLCSPNNPTGQTLPLATIEKIVRQSKKIVVVDEAYIEFCPRKSVKKLLRKYSNLIILRTFSKAWGLAGLRVGYALSSPEIINILAKVRAPYSVDTLSAKLAEKALTRERKMKLIVKKILIEKEKLAVALEKLGLIVSPSDANFLLVKFPARVIASKVQQSLMKKFGIIIRDFNKLGLKNCARITVGTSGENVKLLRALQEIF